MTPLSDLETLKNQTWNALKDYRLDNKDTKSVNRWEKLTKLYMNIIKQMTRQHSAKEEENKLDEIFQ